MKTILMLCCLALTLSVWSQATQKKTTQPQPKQVTVQTKKTVITKEPPMGNAVSPEIVEKFYENLVSIAEKDLENFATPSYMKYSSLHDDLVKLMNYQFLELDSEIELSWFKKVDDFISFFYKTKRTNDLGFQAADSPKKIENKKRFETGLANFKKFLEKEPPKPKLERLEVLKRQKQEYEREKRLKEKTQGKGSDGKQKLFDGDK